MSPETLKKFRDINFKQSVSMLSDLKRRKFWKPDKFQISKKSAVDIPNTSASEGGAGGGK